MAAEQNKQGTLADLDSLSASDLVRTFPVELCYEAPEGLSLTGPTAIIYTLFRTMLAPQDKPTEAAKVQAARELANRLWGRVPIVEQHSSTVTLDDLDLSGLEDKDAREFRRILSLALMYAETNKDE